MNQFERFLMSYFMKLYQWDFISILPCTKTDNYSQCNQTDDVRCSKYFMVLIYRKRQFLRPDKKLKIDIIISF